MIKNGDGALTDVKVPFVKAEYECSDDSFRNGNTELVIDMATQAQQVFNKLVVLYSRVATVREKVLENEKISRSGKSQGITFSVREIKKKMKKVMEKSGNFKIFLKRCKLTGFWKF